MSLDILEKYLKPWMIVETWSSGESPDDKRFYEGVRNVALEARRAFDQADFRAAMSSLAEKHGIRGVGPESLSHFGYQGAVIMSYLEYTGQFPESN